MDTMDIFPLDSQAATQAIAERNLGVIPSGHWLPFVSPVQHEAACGLSAPLLAAVGPVVLLLGGRGERAPGARGRPDRAGRDVAQPHPARQGRFGARQAQGPRRQRRRRGRRQVHVQEAGVGVVLARRAAHRRDAQSGTYADKQCMPKRKRAFGDDMFMPLSACT